MLTIQVASCLQVSGVQGVTSSLTGLATPMIQLFQRLYSTRAAPSIIKYNNFSDVGMYFLLKVNTKHHAMFVARKLMLLEINRMLMFHLMQTIVFTH